MGAAATAEGTAPGAAGPGTVLSVRGLSVRFRLARGRRVDAVTDVNLDVAAGECLVLVGESGCGKSVLASALLGLVPANAETAGSARIAGLDLLTADERTLARRVRGRLVGLVPQSPAAHLTPVRTIRSQLEETVAELAAVRGRTALRAAAEAAAARAAFPADHLDRHPHQLSGGLAQRAATALALVGDAPLLLADEPTTGLDRDLVDRTVDELRRHVAGTGAAAGAGTETGPAPDSGGRDGGAGRRHAAARGGGGPGQGGDGDAAGRGGGREAAAWRRGPGGPSGRALLMITHDLAAAERIADRVAVMYAGRIVELADATAFFGTPGPRHPYSRGLLRALPDRDFVPIPGTPPELGDLPAGCAFAPRCDRATGLCATPPPVTGGLACHHPFPGPGPGPGPGGMATETVPATPDPEDAHA
ncbi:ABC transporter ATP-binding protein [Streptomyces zingiberis]|uniref:ABC transporter ATP-binding protein n=1 Tax=Streptomyces zingiberis TaxID=2053010 RepID=A0ABX1C0U4_9ACTN|nr:ABC transporter ATP-binding protein [Streptomyces zingiberis]NJQ03539.1 ABC transporter ATP-binding protein [Streptomyces zingiberis]